MEQCHFQHSWESKRLSIFPTCMANWYPRKLTSINNRNPQTHKKRSCFERKPSKMSLDCLLYADLFYIRDPQWGNIYMHACLSVCVFVCVYVCGMCLCVFFSFFFFNTNCRELWCHPYLVCKEFNQSSLDLISKHSCL